MIRKAFLLFAMACGFASFGVHAQDGDLYAFSSQGDADKGKRIFNQCRACHNLTGDRPHKVGPNLNGLFSRQAGSVDDYGRYSKALSEADFMWTEAKLDEWLTSPRGFLPGNKMSFAGLRREQDRKDLLAYLRQATLDASVE